MVFKSDNYSERFFMVALLPWASIVFFWPLFSSEPTFTGKIILSVSGLALLILPVRSFIFRRYQIVCEENEIRVSNFLKSIGDKTFSYHQLESITFAGGGSEYCRFVFCNESGKKSRFSVELNKQEEIIQLILHCKEKNKDFVYKIPSPYTSDYVRREMRKRQTEKKRL